MIVTAWAGIASPAGATQVICLTKDSSHLVYRKQPRACTFHKRHAPYANAFEVITRHDHWSLWGRHRARGKGKAIASMTGPTPVRIRLYKARKVCGHRVFTHAHFFYPKLGSGGTMTLDNCT